MTRRLTLALLAALCFALPSCGGSDDTTEDLQRDAQPPACSRIPNPCV